MGLTEGKKEEPVIRIGTRSSRLALAQTQLAADAIRRSVQKRGSRSFLW